MRVATWVLAITALVWPARDASGQTFAPVTRTTAAEALQFLLDKNIDPGGPLRGDGATIAGVVVGQSLTFPISSSSGAFALRKLTTLGPSFIEVSTSGSFGSLFAERADTNGRGGFSLGVTYQSKRWGSLAGIPLQGFQLSLREVYRNDVPNLGVAGTSDDFAADIDYRTTVFVVAANYGVLSWVDAGVSIPWISATVDGTKRRMRAQPAQAPVLVHQQQVTGRSVGLGDIILRVKARLLRERSPGSQPESDLQKRGSGRPLNVALGFDLRMPTGATVELFLDCRAPPCPGGNTQDVPDLGLGALTKKVLFVVSGDVRRLSPQFNFSYFVVPSYRCDGRFSTTGFCKGAVFVVDPLTDEADAKNQNLSDEITATIGASYQLLPYRATVSFDVISRRLVNAGQFFRGPARLRQHDDGPDRAVSTEIESRPGHVDTYVAVAGAKIGFAKRWVAVTSLLFPLNRQGLQPRTTWLAGLERSLGR